MSETNGSISDLELTDINKGRSPAHSPGQNSGPWTNRTDAYSKKLHATNSVAKRHVKDRYHCLYAVVCITVFVAGLGLGIIIGFFGINRTADDENMTGNTSSIYSNTNAMSSVLTTTQRTMTKRSHNVSHCVCPTLTSAFTTAKSHEKCRRCPTRNPNLSTGTESKQSPFAALTMDEMKLAIKALEFKGLITSSGSPLTRNRAAHVFLHPVKKAQALDYLDNKGAFPGRYAQVNVVRGGNSPPDFMEYKVGPLNETILNLQIEQLKADGAVHFNRRPFDTEEYFAIRRVASKDIPAINELLKESFDGAYFKSGIDFQFAIIPSQSEDDRKSTAFLYLKLGGYLTIRILPVTCIIHHPGTVTNNWYASDFYYASQGPFDSWTEMQEAYTNGTLRKVRFPKSYRENHQFEYDLTLNSSEPERELSNLPPPRTYEPEGPRYTIKGHRISWMGWEFEFSSSPMHGPVIFDVKFKNKRIAYEISLQDVTLIYSSQTNGAGPPALSDTIFLLGSYNVPRYGLDCPERGSLVYSTHYFYGTLKNNPAACVFEADGQRPLWRHGNLGLADHHLIIRASMYLGNYDYTLEWKFFLDGSLETVLSASGYLYGAFWDPEDENINGSDKSATPFGYRISDYQLGPIHNHNYLFKVDLDILGSNNSFQTISWRAGSTLEAFQTRSNITEKPGYFYFNNTRYIEPAILQKENSFLVNSLKPKYYAVINENERNLWGNIRGYRVIPHLLSANVLQEHMMLNAWEDLRFHLAVTRQNDSEQYGTTSWYDLSHPGQAFKGVGRMLNNESARQEDIVLWITQKFLHAPSSEDLPMTLSVPSGFTLKPFNYFDRTPVFDVQSHFSKYSNPYDINLCYENLK